MKVDRLITQKHKHIPRDKEDGVLYVSEEFGTAIHLCACGCKSETVTPFHPARGWTYTEDTQGPTLHPSIGNQDMPCKSHYWVENGKIEWC